MKKKLKSNNEKIKRFLNILLLTNYNLQNERRNNKTLICCVYFPNIFNSVNNKKKKIIWFRLISKFCIIIKVFIKRT